MMRNMAEMIYNVQDIQFRFLSLQSKSENQQFSAKAVNNPFLPTYLDAAR